MVLASEWGVGQVLWTMIWFTLLFLWIWVVIAVLTDLFMSRDVSGWGKAFWVLFVIMLPFLGVLTYLITRGGRMHERAAARAKTNDEATKQYIRETVATAPGSSAPVDDLAKLDDLKQRGVIDADDFERMKAKITT
jgi:hypothetical protein